MMNQLTRFPIVTFVLLLLTSACGKNDHQVNERLQLPQPSQTTRVQRESRMVDIAGTIRATDIAQLASRYASFVSSVNVQAGMQVKKGDVLVLMDDRNLQAQRAKAKAARDEAQRGVQAVEAQMRLADVTFTRMEMLSQRKAVSEQEYDEAKSKRESAGAAYQAALQRVLQAESDVRDVQASSDYLRITAPFTGIITSVGVDAGTFVNAGQTLVSMENRSGYEVVFSVEEGLLKEVRKGMVLTVVIPAISISALRAKVEEVDTAADVNTRTFQIKAILETQTQLQSGLFAHVFISTATEGSFWIPETFLSRNNDIETVLVKHGKEWSRVLVKSGDRKNGKVEILSGLNENEEVGI